ncbi:MAG: hypothetical protein ACON4O_03740, partial [Lentimonas sp.]
YFEFFLERPPNDESIGYQLMVSTNLSAGFVAADEESYQVMETEILANGKERVRYRFLKPVVLGTPRFFRFDWQNL